MSLAKVKRSALVAVLSAIAALSVVGVGSASAAPATWNPGGEFLLKGTLSVTNGAAAPYPCTVYIDIPAAGSGFMFGAGGSTDCKLTFAEIRGTATLDAGVYHLNFAEPLHGRGEILQLPFSVAWTNASGATPSYVTFNNTQIGALYHATGKLEVIGGSLGMPLLK